MSFFFIKKGSKWFSPNDGEAMMIWMTPEFKEFVKNMSEDCFAASWFPMTAEWEGKTKKEMANWMNEGREELGIPLGKTYEDDE